MISNKTNIYIQRLQGSLKGSGPAKKTTHHSQAQDRNPLLLTYRGKYKKKNYPKTYFPINTTVAYVIIPSMLNKQA